MGHAGGHDAHELGGGGAGEEGADGERGFGLAHEDAGGDVGGLCAAGAHGAEHDPGDEADDALHEAEVVEHGKEGADEDDGGEDGEGEDGRGLPGVPSGPKTSEEPSTEWASSEVTMVEAVWRMRWPSDHLMTRKAKRICRLRPQATVRQRMARRLVEASQAMRRKTARPSRPVSRGKGAPWTRGMWRVYRVVNITLERRKDEIAGNESCGRPKIAAMREMALEDAVSGSPLAAASAQRGGRLVSLDAFRGLCVAGMLLVTDPGTYRAIYPQLRHAEWRGGTAADMIFPGFLFAVGVATPLALGGRLARGASRGAVWLSVLRRAVLLVVIGLVLNLYPTFSAGTLRLPGFCSALGFVFWLKRRCGC